MNKYCVVPATQDHIDNMKGRMREADEAECLAMTGENADTCLQVSFEDAYLCWVGLSDGEPVTCFGVTAPTFLSRIGTVWLLGTNEVLKARTALPRFSRVYVPKMLAPFDIIGNYVDVRNTLSIAWLKWCGFTIDDPAPYGINGEIFCRFWMIKGGC